MAVEEASSTVVAVRVRGVRVVVGCRAGGDGGGVAATAEDGAVTIWGSGGGCLDGLVGRRVVVAVISEERHGGWIGIVVVEGK